MFLIAISIILCILAFNTKLYFLIFIGLVPFFLFLIREKKFWKLILGSFLFRLFFALGTVYFIIDPILYFLSILIFLGLPISFFLIRKYSSFIANMSLPFLWVIWDYLESQYTLLPMTLIMMGIPLAESPFLGLARFGGIIGLTLFVSIINILIVYLFLNKNNSKKRIYLFSILLITLILAFLCSSFFIKKNKNDYLSKKNVLRISLLSVDRVRYGTDSFLDLLDLGNSDLLVVPENFYKYSLDNTFESINFYRKKSKELGIDISTVLLRYENKKTYTSNVLFSKNGEIKDIYNKNILTITSENWSFRSWRPFYFNSYLKHASFRDKQKAIFDYRYQHEKGVPKLVFSDNFSFFSPICLELHYLGYVKKMTNLNPNFILHNSNNDWINRGLDKYLHFTNNLRKIYAVWLNKPILVNGIMDYAGIFYPDGSSNLNYAPNISIINNIEVRF